HSPQRPAAQSVFHHHPGRRAGCMHGAEIRTRAGSTSPAGSAREIMNMKYPMTKAGAQALEDELRHLKTVMRPQITEAIAEARELGDLKENAEYHAAREQQGMAEARISDSEGRLAAAQGIDVTTIPYAGKVIFGTTVTIANVDSDEEVKYQIVGEDEAEIKEGKISVTSPIARALIGKEEGEIVAVRTPGGVVEYEIIEVRHL